MRKGSKLTEEHKQKLRKARLGKPISEETKKKISESLKGRYFSPETRKKISDACKGLKNTPEHNKKVSEARMGKFGEEKCHLWRGDKVGYDGIHHWIKKKLGKAKMCCRCKEPNRKRYQWANISHQYKRELNDWVQLCVSCHKFCDSGIYDITKIDRTDMFAKQEVSIFIRI